jgi:hypothetical protein
MKKPAGGGGLGVGAENFSVGAGDLQLGCALRQKPSTASSPPTISRIAPSIPFVLK